MQMYSTTGEVPLETFLRELLQRNLDRVLMANQPGELPVCPTEDPGGTGGELFPLSELFCVEDPASGGEVRCGIPDEPSGRGGRVYVAMPDEPSVGGGKAWNVMEREELILACSESVKAMAWKFVRSSSRIEFDEMYSIGMLAVCEAVPHLVGGANPFPYLCKTARYAMVDEYRRTYDCSIVSLDAPLSNDSSFSLGDVLSAPALVPAAPTSSKRSQALNGAMRRLASTRQRAVLRRRYGLEGYGAHSMKEAARSLHTSLGVINNADRRGLRNLRADAWLRAVVGVEVAQ